MNSFTTVLVTLIILSFTLTCQSKSEIIPLPPNVPSSAKYNKKINSFELIQNNRVKVWFQDGSLYSDCEINSLGLKNGNCVVYSKEQKILSQGQYKNAQKDGLWFWYFPNGNVYVKQNYKYGKKRSYWIEADEFGNEDGEYFKYYPNEQLEEEGFFDGGYKTNSWKKYYKNGQIEYTGSYEKDKKILKWIYYYPNGLIESKEDYDKTGNLISRTTYSPQGELLCQTDLGKIECK